MKLNKKLISVATVTLISASLILTSCNNNDHQDHDNMQKSMTQKQFEKLPYSQYYTKDDLTEDSTSQNWAFKDEKTKKRIQRKILVEGSDQKYIEDNTKDELYSTSQGSANNANYKLNKMTQFKSAALDLKVNDVQKYSYNTIINTKDKSFPFKVENELNTANIQLDDNQDANEVYTINKDNNEGIIRVDITAKNKSDHNMSVGSLTHVASNKYDAAEPILGKVQIGNDKKLQKDDINNIIDKNIKPNESMRAKIYYLIDNDVNKEEIDLIADYELGEHFSNDQIVIKVGL